MPTIAFDTTEFADRADGIGLRLDEPAPGTGHERLAIRISGRLSGDVPEGARVRVRARGRGQDWPLQTVQGGPGIKAIVSALDVPPAFRIDGGLVVAGTETRLVSITGRRTPGLTPDAGGPAPVLLAALGRSGSTWAMRLLAAHPEVVVHRAYPFETRLLQYHVELAALQTRPADLEDPDLERLGGPGWIKANPYFRPDETRYAWLSDAGARLALAHAARSAQAFYAHVAEAQGDDPGTHVAEKAPPDPARLDRVRAVHPGSRVLALLRDPRDVVASVKAFDAKRGFDGFGRGDAGDDASFAGRIARGSEALARLARNRDDTVILRYEDLAAAPLAAMAAVLPGLGLSAGDPQRDAIAAAVQADDALLSYHRTTISPAASVGRWRSDLTHAEKAACAAEMGANLAHFGYTAGP